MPAEADEKRGARGVVITGFMAAGKTTVARELARRLCCAFVDLDELIAAREGRTPQELIDDEGEARFRELESEALRAALESGADGVIALGGGAWTLERNRTLVASHGCLTVWLDAPFELCWRRIGEAGGGGRPLARDAGETRRLYDERRGSYALAARVEAGAGRRVESIVAEIAHALGASRGGL